MKIGITGHQNLGTQYTKQWVKKVLFEEITKLASVEAAYSSLAVGADQLFGEIVLQHGINLYAIIPCSNYDEAFDSRGKKKYLNLVSLCHGIEELSFPYPSEEAFLSAGKLMVDHADLVFAVWDGLPAKGLGGTGDIVEYAISKKKQLIHLHPIEKFARII